MDVWPSKNLVYSFCRVLYGNVLKYIFRALGSKHSCAEHIEYRIHIHIHIDISPCTNKKTQATVTRWSLKDQVPRTWPSFVDLPSSQYDSNISPNLPIRLFIFFTQFLSQCFEFSFLKWIAMFYYFEGWHGMTKKTDFSGVLLREPKSHQNFQSGPLQWGSHGTFGCWSPSIGDATRFVDWFLLTLDIQIPPEKKVF